MCRGDQGEPIFVSDADQEMFLTPLGEGCEQTGWRVPAYLLMRNHYHGLLETPTGNLVAGMERLQSTYTRREVAGLAGPGAGRRKRHHDAARTGGGWVHPERGFEGAEPEADDYARSSRYRN